MKNFVPTANQFVWLARVNRKLNEIIKLQKQGIELRDEQIKLLEQLAFGKTPEAYKQAVDRQQQKALREAAHKPQPFKVIS
jgi:hypothetical protein